MTRATDRRAAGVGIIALVALHAAALGGGCGATRDAGADRRFERVRTAGPREADAPRTAVTAPTVAAASGGDTPDERAAASSATSADTHQASPACALVSIAFDHRALPTTTSPEGFDNWVVGNADDIRRAAPPGAPPRMYTQPGGGRVDALFDGATAEDVLSRCQATVAAYLPTAPALPLIGYGSAAHVVVPCSPCD
jgi:hypothetical protein